MRRTLTERLSEPGLRLRALPLSSKVALGVLALVVLLAIFAPLIARFDPLASGTPALPPDGVHWFGTDIIGRDIFARVAFGTRSSLVIGLFATLVALAAAAILGSIAATAGKASTQRKSECSTKFIALISTTVDRPANPRAQAVPGSCRGIAIRTRPRVSTPVPTM